MSRLKILEIKNRLERLEQLQEERRNEAARQGMDSALAMQKRWRDHEDEHRYLRLRLDRVERRGVIKTLVIVLLLGAWAWTQQ